MKKLTKLTALALALALLLGMSAMAAPAEIIMTDDYSEIADFNAFKTGRTSLAATFTRGGTFTFESGATGALATNTKYYYSRINPNWKALDIITLNGKQVYGTDETAGGGFWKPGEEQVAYTFDSAWTYSEDYALVAQMGWIARPMTGNNQKMSNTNSSGFAGALLTHTDNGNDVNYSDGIAGMTVEAPSADGSAVNAGLMPATQDKSVNTYLNYSATKTGVENKITTVIRPYDITDEDVVSVEDKSLDLITHLNGRWVACSARPDYEKSHYHIAGGKPVTAVHGLYYTAASNTNLAFTGFRTYKVSLAPADFTITSEKNIVDREVDSVITVAFSQPISENLANEASLLESITITPNGGEALVYGEDYSINIQEVVSNNAISEKLVITPITGWNYDTTYTIGLPAGFKNIARISMNDATPEDEATCDVVTFTTLAAPTFDVTLKAYNGLSATESAEVSALSKGTTYFAVSAAYREGKVVANGTLRLEIKDANGNTVKYVTAKKALGTGTATFGAAFKVEAGYTAKVTIDGGIIGEATID